MGNPWLSNGTEAHLNKSNKTLLFIAQLKNRAIRQNAYALYKAGSISLDEEGNFSYSGSGPYYKYKV